MSVVPGFGFGGGLAAEAVHEATTYEWALEHGHLREPGRWPQVYGQIPCWVFTHRQLAQAPGANVIFARGDPREVHEQMMAAAEGRNLWLVGGGDIAGQFAGHGLLDEILLMIAPVMLGAGTPVLTRRILAPGLTLDTVEHDTRFVYLTYTMTGHQRGQQDVTGSTPRRTP